MVLFLCNPRCQCFVPFLHNFSYLMSLHGIPSEVRDTYDYTSDDGRNLWFVIWNGLPRLPKRCIVYNMDPMVPHIEKEFREIVARSPDTTIVQFLDYSGNNYQQISDLGLPWGKLTYGHSSYHAHLKEQYVPTLPEQDIDILFYGNIMQARRMRFIQALQRLAHKRNYRFVFRHYDLFNEAEKVTMIARAKVIVSFASEDTLKFRSNDLARSAQVISSGGFMIAEHVGDPVEDQLVKYVAYYHTLDEFITTVDHYLQHPEARSAMITRALAQFPLDFNLEQDLLAAVTPHL